MRRISNLAGNRTVDVIAAFGIAMGSLPAFLIIAVAVKLTSRGPIFYRQPKRGLLPNGKAAPMFKAYKFRTVRIDTAPDDRAAGNTKHNYRVTKIGFMLKATRLDMLPQIWNVLKGDMSLMGPRSDRPALMTSGPGRR